MKQAKQRVAAVEARTVKRQHQGVYSVRHWTTTADSIAAFEAGNVPQAPGYGTIDAARRANARV